MAKIDIYETETDVKREALKEKVSFGNRFIDFTVPLGTFFSATALLSHLAEIGDIFNAYKNGENVSRKTFMKRWVGGNAILGSTFLLMGTVAALKIRSDKMALNALGQEEPQQVIVPDNLSSEALNMISIRPVPTQDLYKAPQATIQTQTSQLLDTVKTQIQQAPTKN